MSLFPQVCNTLRTLVAVLLLTVGTALPATAQPADDRAAALSQDLLVFDGHVDTPYRLSRFYEDVSEPTQAGDFDLPRARDGGLDAAFMAVYVPASLQARPDDARRHADRILDLVDRMAATSAALQVATSPGEVRSIARGGGVAIALSMENGAGLGGDVGSLAHFYERGIRYVTLTHSKHNRIGDASYDQSPPRWDGLSPFGREVVREMNRLGMMVDVSHVSDATAYDVLDASRAPVIASHSSCRHFTPGWERNLSDDLIRAIAETGGVVLVNFGSNFLRTGYKAREARVRDRTYGYIDSRGWSRSAPEALLHRHRQRVAHPVGTVADVADHVDRVVEIAGIEHVGIGSDFDGIFALPKGLQDVSHYPNLIAELLRRGYSDSDLAMIFGGNLLRVWEEVER
jgi:membrane dipeptidase